MKAQLITTDNAINGGGTQYKLTIEFSILDAIEQQEELEALVLKWIRYPEQQLIK